MEIIFHEHACTSHGSSCAHLHLNRPGIKVRDGISLKLLGPLNWIKIQKPVFTIDEQFKKISAQLEAIDKSIAALDMNLSDFNAKAPKEDTAASRIEKALATGAFDKFTSWVADKQNKS